MLDAYVCESTSEEYNSELLKTIVLDCVCSPEEAELYESYVIKWWSEALELCCVCSIA